MTTSSKKTASVFTRISPELKQQAEEVLDQLQIPMSTALSMFLQQVVNQRGIPFDVKLPAKPVDYRKLTKKQFDSEINKGFDDLKKGRTYSAEQIRSEFSNGK